MGKIADAVGSILDIFTGGSETTQQPATPAPTVTPPTVMPTPDDEAARAAKKKLATSLQARKGRQSTILDAQSDLLGG